ncbi:hypothetical protein [Croceimicrobium sp.]|uniref:hypothetical protein n=1 Tax=Croceimicrobium sp. TaxID=2828340 RepID=UPI003BA92618
MTFEVVHPEGAHNAKPWFVWLLIGLVSLISRKVTLEFSVLSRYYLDKEDQGDLNKIIGRGGFRGKMINEVYTRKDEKFLAWRFNPSRFRFEIFHYWRDNYKMRFEKVGELSPGQRMIFDIGFMKSWRSARLLPIPPYFGGNRPAPDYLVYKLKFHLW